MTRQHSGREAEWKRAVWEDGDRILAWGWIKPPGQRLFWDADPRRPELLDEIFAWFVSEAEHEPLSVAVRSGNQAAVEALERRGFSRDREAPWLRMNARDLDEVEEPTVPAGYRLTTMAETPDLRSASPCTARLSTRRG